jgi:hypothetical protein
MDNDETTNSAIVRNIISPFNHDRLFKHEHKQHIDDNICTYKTFKDGCSVQVSVNKQGIYIERLWWAGGFSQDFEEATHEIDLADPDAIIKAQKTLVEELEAIGIFISMV